MKLFILNKKNSRSGQSLMELLVGMAVGAVLIIGSVTIITSSLQSNSQVRSIQMQAQLAQELLNNVKSWAQGNWNGVLALATGTSNTYALNTSSSPFTILGSISSYSYSRSITVSSNASGTNVNFPMLFSASYSWLEPVSAGGHIQNLTTAPNGGQEPADLIFTSDSGCTTPLNFETESYTSSTGAIVDWVNIPSLSSGTVIYACYGNSSVATDQSHPSSTWNTNYVGVWHLGNAGAATSTDSTLNGHNGTNVNTTSTSGKIGNAGSFNGTSAYVGLGTTNLWTGGVGTASAWVKTATTGSANNYVIAYGDDYGPQSWGMDVIPQGNTSSTQISFLYGNARWVAATPSINATTWHEYDIVATGSSTQSVYADGSLVASASYGVITPGTSLGMNIGKTDRSAPYQYFTNGSIDEPRILKTPLSASWILTEYNNQSNPFTFYTVGSEQAGISNGTSTAERVVANGVTYQRSFYLSDVYRDSSGNVTTTISGNFYDPSTKLFTASVRIASSTIAPMVYSMYITRNTINILDQTNWTGGSGFTTAKTFVSSTYAAAVNATTSSSGAFSIASIPAAGANGYGYYRSITAASAQVSSTNTNFPMLFSASYSWLAASSSGGLVQDPNGNDIIFTSDAAGASKLNWEVESYTSSTGNIVAWINVPSLSTSTVIYIYYDNPSINTFQGNATGTWNSNYIGVYHLAAPTGTLQVYDSTVNANAASNSGLSTTTGQIGGSANDGGSSYATIGTSGGALNLTSPFTISAWINPSTLPTSNGQVADIVEKGYDGTNEQYSFTLQDDSNTASSPGLLIGTYNGSSHGTYWNYGGNITTGNWYNVVGQYTGTQWKLYENGIAVASNTDSQAPISTSLSPIIGAANINGSITRNFNGGIDEVRVANTALSPSWILTEYNNQNSPNTFYTVGSQATSTGGGGGGGTATTTLDSQPFDTGSLSGAVLNSFEWQGSTPAGTTVAFQFAVSNSSSGPWTYVGPDGTANTYYSVIPGTSITLLSSTNGYALFSGHRYFAYRVSLSAPAGSTSPTVSEVSVNWSP